MSKDYFNQMADKWDKEVAEKDTAKLDKLAHSLSINRGDTVLDVGTGTGILIPHLLEKIGENGRLVALDSASEMLKKAKEKGFKGNIEYVDADVTGVPLPDVVFDAVVCYASFPHFKDKAKALIEISRLLKKGGWMFICHTASRAKINERHRKKAALANDLIPDSDEMRAMLALAGFEDVNILETEESYLASARKASSDWAQIRSNRATLG